MKNYVVSVLLYITNKNTIREKKKWRGKICFLLIEEKRTEQGKKKRYKMDNSLPRNPFSKMSFYYRLQTVKIYVLFIGASLTESNASKNGDNILVIFRTPTSFWV